MYFDRNNHFLITVSSSYIFEQIDGKLKKKKIVLNKFQILKPLIFLDFHIKIFFILSHNYFRCFSRCIFPVDSYYVNF